MLTCRRIICEIAAFLLVSGFSALCDAANEGGLSKLHPSRVVSFNGHFQSVIRLSTRGGLGFDDLRYALRLDRILVPAGRTGALDAVDPQSMEISTVSGLAPGSKTFTGHTTTDRLLPTRGAGSCSSLTVQNNVSASSVSRACRSWPVDGWWRAPTTFASSGAAMVLGQ
jgi:hypothetical protein